MQKKLMSFIIKLPPSPIIRKDEGELIELLIQQLHHIYKVWDLCACGQHAVYFFYLAVVSISAKELKVMSQNIIYKFLKNIIFIGCIILWSNSHIIHDYWKNHSFDYWDLCWQSDVLHKFIFQVFIEHLLYYERASLVAQ